MKTKKQNEKRREMQWACLLGPQGPGGTIALPIPGLFPPAHIMSPITDSGSVPKNRDKATCFIRSGRGQQAPNVQRGSSAVALMWLEGDPAPLACAGLTARPRDQRLLLSCCVFPCVPLMTSDTPSGVLEP